MFGDIAYCGCQANPCRAQKTKTKMPFRAFWFWMSQKSPLTIGPLFALMGYEAKGKMVLA